MEKRRIEELLIFAVGRSNYKKIKKMFEIKIVEKNGGDFCFSTDKGKILNESNKISFSLLEKICLELNISLGNNNFANEHQKGITLSLLLSLPKTNSEKKKLITWLCRNYKLVKQDIQQNSISKL